MRERPKRSREALQTLSAMRSSYADSLQKIAEEIARHERMETVQRAHVERAQQTLATGGESLRPFWQRREFQTGAGCLLASSAFAVPRDDAATVALTAVLFIGGTVLAVYGWVRP